METLNFAGAWKEDQSRTHIGHGNRSANDRFPLLIGAPSRFPRTELARLTPKSDLENTVGQQTSLLRVANLRLSRQQKMPFCRHFKRRERRGFNPPKTPHRNSELTNVLLADHPRQCHARRMR
jgi:hypothetical protein